MEEIEDIERAATAGDVSAMTALGKRKLAQAGTADQLEDAVRLLGAAAESGSAEADYFNSLVWGIFAHESQEWSVALAHLLRSAERGWPTAREQLCLLAADRDLAEAAQSGQCDNGAWRKLRDSIDLSALLGSPAATVVRQAPCIKTIKAFASKAECEWMIERSRPRLQRARMINAHTQHTPIGIIDPRRTNSATFFDVLDSDFIVVLLRARIALATQFPRPSLEVTGVMHYARGQRFPPHVDWFNPKEVPGAEEIRTKGQRVGTFLMYLNDGFEGAETEFPLIDWRHKGAQGDALFFMNVDESGGMDRLTLHAGLAPTSGEKWLLSQWIRGRPGVGL